MFFSHFSLGVGLIYFLVRVTVGVNLRIIEIFVWTKGTDSLRLCICPRSPSLPLTHLHPPFNTTMLFLFPPRSCRAPSLCPLSRYPPSLSKFCHLPLSNFSLYHTPSLYFLLLLLSAHTVALYFCTYTLVFTKLHPDFSFLFPSPSCSTF